MMKHFYMFLYKIDNKPWGETFLGFITGVIVLFTVIVIPITLIASAIKDMIGLIPPSASVYNPELAAIPGLAIDKTRIYKEREQPQEVVSIPVEKIENRWEMLDL